MIPRLKTALCMTAWASALGGCGSAPSPPPEPLKPSVLLVVMDTVRADVVGTMGATRPLTPQMDAVADAGATFTDVTPEGPCTWPRPAPL